MKRQIGEEKYILMHIKNMWHEVPARGVPLRWREPAQALAGQLRALSRYTKVVSLLPGEDTYKNQLMNASITKTKNWPLSSKKKRENLPNSASYYPFGSSQAILNSRAAY